MNVNIKLVKGGKLPEYKTDGAACFDCYARLDESKMQTVYHDGEEQKVFEVKPLETAVIPLGFCIEVPVGFEMQVRPRSGMSMTGVVVVLGTIDDDYRGEVGVVLTNTNNIHSLYVMNGDRICQGTIKAVEKVVFNVVDKLSGTKRGICGFGSTGVK